MRTLLTTTAITFALAMTNVAVASTTFTKTDDNYKIEIALESQIPLSLIVNDESFYYGDFLLASEAKLSSLTSEDMYTGMGAAMVPTTRDVT